MVIPIHANFPRYQLGELYHGYFLLSGATTIVSIPVVIAPEGNGFNAL